MHASALLLAAAFALAGGELNAPRGRATGAVARATGRECEPRGPQREPAAEHAAPPTGHDPAAGAGKPVVWRASYEVTRAIPHVQGLPLCAHFARPETPRVILDLHPGVVGPELLRVVDASTSIWTGRTEPLRFGAGVCVVTHLTYRVTHKRTELVLEVLDSSTETRGPAMMTRMLATMLPKVCSTTTARCAGGNLICRTQLELKLPFPRWFPLPRRRIETVGPPILEKQIAKDLSVLLNGYAAVYAVEAGVAATGPRGLLAELLDSVDSL
ncbi:hypothetical protein T492DRAFT_1100125 [Pavlovales sp. CCMP2436]|nr:hypothetical protein T492DRAFT_1100125 [Pavlovales sp. CCMP2436]